VLKYDKFFDINEVKLSFRIIYLKRNYKIRKS